MSGLAINQIIITVNKEIRATKDRLEVEEGGRDIASDQGKIRGYRLLISFMAAELDLTQIMLDDLGEEPMDLIQGG